MRLTQIRIQISPECQKDGDTCIHPCSHIRRRRQDEVGDSLHIFHCCRRSGETDSNHVCHDEWLGVFACSQHVGYVCCGDSCDGDGDGDGDD